MRHKDREAEIQQREKQAPQREPNVGLDPRIPGSCPELKADAQPLSHPGVQQFYYIKHYPKDAPFTYAVYKFQNL